MKILASLDAIEKIPAFGRIAEIQQRINEIQKNFGVVTTPQTNSNNNFQVELEQAMAKVKPIEQFLAENKVMPVNENAAANAEKVAMALIGDNSAGNSVRMTSDTENFNTETLRRNEESAPNSTEGMIEAAARRFGVDSELIKAIATAESNMNQNARSHVGAIGVMQLMPETAESLGVNPYDEKQNIEGGTRYVRQMLDKFNGNLQNAIAAYNAGPGAVQKYGGVPPYNETQNYVGRVLDFYVR